MATIKITIKNGKITTEASGYRGSACQGPLSGLMEALGGKVESEEITEEGTLPDEPIFVEGSEELKA
jgi:hypothetical protein